MTREQALKRWNRWIYDPTEGGAADLILAIERETIVRCAKDLDAAVSLLKRGKKAMNRQGWEPGETDAEWMSAADNFIATYENWRDYEKEQAAKGGAK